jgi:hypothetical protein
LLVVGVAAMELLEFLMQQEVEPAVFLPVY